MIEATLVKSDGTSSPASVRVEGINLVIETATGGSGLSVLAVEFELAGDVIKVRDRLPGGEDFELHSSSADALMLDIQTVIDEDKARREAERRRLN